MSRPPSCECPPGIPQDYEPQLLADSIEEVRIKSLVYRREGYYDVKKLIDRVWAPSDEAECGTAGMLHLCKCVFWNNTFFCSFEPS